MSIFVTQTQSTATVVPLKRHGTLKIVATERQGENQEKTSVRQVINGLITFN